ncbi:ABC transporter permease [Nocardia bovistercoris]|uniref:Transport permease protein n=1 Tax=Nocardia bovistercoris TaxID=2785916 RepID=A0A931ID90_9NOCA|nr:ABC transporter permease [Nocardia bovistercoris]MBH0779304.1 ABC transporter permease [Nocardia bovistercoris]
MTATPAPHTAAPRRVVAQAVELAALTGRAVRVTLRDPALIGPATLFPVILLVLITVSFGTLVAPGGDRADYVNYSLPLFAVMGILFAGLGTAMTAFADLHSGFDARLRTMPISRSAPLLGRVLGDGVRNLITLIVVVLVGYALGFRFSGPAAGTIGFFLLPLVFGSAVAWVMVAFAVRASSAEAVTSALNALLLVASFLSTGFVPRAQLPGWVQPIAAANPVSSVVETMRALASSGAIAEPLARASAWTVGLTVVFGVLAVRGYSRHDSRG